MGVVRTIEELRRAERMLASQQDWIEQHGGSREAYIALYGSEMDVDHYGDGGEAIWDADCRQLMQYEAEVWALSEEVKL